MKFFFSLGLLAMIHLPNFSFAQMGGTGVIAGSGSSPASTPADLAMMWFLERFRFIDIDAQVKEMQDLGVRSRTYLGFTASGALVYESELNGKPKSNYALTGRDTGAQFVPYTISIQEGGGVLLTSSAFALRNMNTHAHFYGGYGIDPVPGKTTAWSFINNLAFITVSWDKNYSFRDLEYFTLDLVRVEPKYAISLGKKGSNNYLAIRATGRYGFGHTLVGNVDGHAVNLAGNAENAMTRLPHGLAGGAEYSGGLELNLETRRGLRFNAQGNWINGVERGKLLQGNQDIPAKRDYAYWQGSAELSQQLRRRKPSKPLRKIGLGGSYTVPVYDAISGGTVPVDLTERFATPYRFYIRFYW